MRNLIKILFLLIALSPLSSFAQENDTKPVDSTLVKYFKTDFTNYYLGKVNVVDTISITASSYDPADQPLLALQTLTNSGTAHQKIGIKTKNYIGFDHKPAAFIQYVKTEEDLFYPITYQPFTQLHYTMATNKEQHLNVIFSRMFLPRFQVTINYNIDFVPAVYKNDKAKNQYLTLNARYLTNDQRYGVVGYFFYNKLKINENAGIKNDTLYSHNIETDREVIDVNLEHAQNSIKVVGFGFNHFVNLDVDNDKIFSAGRINHDFVFKRQGYTYTDSDPLSEFYSNFDTLFFKDKTFDSIFFYNIKNNLHWNNLGTKRYDNEVPLYFDVGLLHEYMKFNGFYNPVTQEFFYRSDYNDLKLHLNVESNLFKTLRLKGNAEVVLFGYHQGDFLQQVDIYQHLGTIWKNYGAVLLSARLSQISPDIFEERYYSNHLRWDNQFNRTRNLEFKAEYQLNEETNLRGLSLGYKHSIVKDHIYYDQTAHPKQFTGTINISTLYANAHLNINNLEITGTAALINTDYEEIVRVPKFYIKGKVGYLIPLVKNISYLQPSATIYYFSSYKADAYMPVTRTFYLQDEVSIGNYPLIDLYVTFKIKRADVYVGYTNLYTFSQVFECFNSPHFPSRDRRFVFGLRWRLYK